MEKITRREALIDQVNDIKAQLADALGWTSKLTERISESLILMDDVLYNLTMDKNSNLDAMLTDIPAEPQEKHYDVEVKARKKREPEPAPKVEVIPRIMPEQQQVATEEPEKKQGIVERALGIDKEKAEKMRQRQEEIAKLEAEIKALQTKR